MAKLAAHREVLVPFSGKRAVDAPLTLGQLNIYQWIMTAKDAHYAMLDWTLDVPPGATVADVTASVAVLLARHEGLRTTYPPGDPPVQRVASQGELTVDVYRVTDPAPAADLATELISTARTRPIDPVTEFPLRVAVAVHAGAVVAGALLCSHLAADFQAMALMGAELTEMIRDPAAREVSDDRHQPVDRAELEHRPARRRRQEAALRSWAERIRRMPSHIYARPRVSAETGSVALWFSSPAAAGALRHIAARTGTSRSAALLAAVCAVLSHRTGYRVCEFPTLSANRFEHQLVDYIGTLAQATCVAVDVGDAGFDEVVRRAFRAVLRTSHDGTYDVYRQAEDSDRVRCERGAELCAEPLFNNVVVETAPPGSPPPAAATLAGVLDRTRAWQVPMPDTSPLLRIDVGRLDDTLAMRLWTGDTGRLPCDEVESLARAVERLLVAAAGHDLDHAAAARSIGLDPIERGAGWLFVDNCWVELAEVQRLLEDALAPLVGRVFPEVDGVPLVAYVARPPAGDGDPAGRGDDAVTPRQIHDRCMDLLPTRHTAMTPRRYVLCDQPPDDPADLAGWRLRRVLAEGTGRTGPEPPPA